jgi:hypothetical protein
MHNPLMQFTPPKMTRDSMASSQRSAKASQQSPARLKRPKSAPPVRRRLSPSESSSGSDVSEAQLDASGADGLRMDELRVSNGPLE